MSVMQQNLGSLNCPSCKSVGLDLASKESLRCRHCHIEYPVLGENCANLVGTDLTATKRDIQTFWGDTCKQWYDPLVENLTTAKLEEHLRNLEDMFLAYKHLAVTEMKLPEVRGLKILEVGSGGGGHSALFKLHGADVTAIDITAERAVSTAKMLSLLPGDSGLSLHADAENLPFQSDTFDIVYSNGVIHHSENTEKCVSEIYRVLKPGGRAIIMLYAKPSATYWLNLIPHGLLSGDIFKYPTAEWIGRITEGRPKFNQIKNSITRVYSRRGILRLFERFRMISLRRGGFVFSTLPGIGRLRTPILRWLGYKPHPGGAIVYGCCRIPATKLKRWLDKYLGWTWNIVCQKQVISHV